MNLQGRKLRRNCISLLIAISLLVTSLFVVDMSTFAAGEATAVITATGLKVREGIGTSYNRVGSLKQGDVVTILDVGYDDSGNVWYQIKTADGIEGWASGAYMNVTASADDFDLYLKLSGFPESYHAGLKALHEKYPNWKFEAQQTGLSWAEVIKAESVLGRNLVQDTSISSWKSTEGAAYDWTTGKWTGYDSAAWVAASKGIIEYYMDPRNFLDENYVFQFLAHDYDAESLTDEAKALVESGLHSMVQNSYLAGNCDEQTYEAVLLKAAAESKVNPGVLVSMLIQEQGRNGGGGSISGEEPGYEGYYNYFNINAYPSGGYTAVQYGLLYASKSGDYGRPWDTREKSIVGGAMWYGDKYVSVGQNTTYLKKFNVLGDNLYKHQYMTNIQGAASEGKILSTAYDAVARQAELTFKIPVYLQMPETACAKPTVSGSPNNKLSSLGVSGYSITPTFNMDVQEYSLIVPNNVSEVTLTAAAYDKAAQISGIGKVALNVGKNTVKIDVKAENGDVRTYTMDIVRSEESSTNPNPSLLTSTVYTVDQDNKLITGISQLPIIAADLKANLSSSVVGEIEVQAADGTVQTGNVGTGNKVVLKDAAGTVKAAYTVLIYGDANGDGNIYATDYRIIKNQIMGDSQLLFDLYAKAADVDRDGNVYATDYRLIKNHIMEVSVISQK